MTAWPTIQISERAYGQIKRGSLWIFSNEFVTKIRNMTPGTWVEFKSKTDLVGFGYINPQSLIAGRICSRTPVKDRRLFFIETIKRAFEKRKTLVNAGSYRAVFSESDDLPGLIVDIYEGPIVVAQFTTSGMDSAKDDVRFALEEVLKPKGLILRGDSSIRHLEGAPKFVDIVKGEETQLRDGKVREDDVLFSANFVEGQKTGFFLDQRENRRHLKALARGLKVLDLCCYSGGWGLSALKGGAEHVTFVDQSEEALELVKKGLSYNHFESSRAKLVVQDVFEFLERDLSQYDVIIADPPAFVKSKKNLPQAVQAYKRLNTLALKKLKPQGTLYSCSCSFHISEEEFEKILAESLQKASRIGTVVYRGTQASDHPWILNRPESHYLKCMAVETNFV